MATYNGAAFLEEQIESILSQTLLPGEIIICDDHSSDATKIIIEKYKNNSLIKPHFNEKQLGVVDNFKKGVSLAMPGHYIALCDQDDIWLPDKLEKSVEALLQIDDEQHPAMVYSDPIVIDKEKKIINTSFQNILGCDRYRHCFETLLFGNFIVGCTILFNAPMRKVFNDIPKSKAYLHDSWIALAAFSFGKAIQLPKPYIHYRHHGLNVTFTTSKKPNRIAKLYFQFKSLLYKTDFIENQLALAKAFNHHYREKFSAEQKNIISKFLLLENTKYFKRKIAFEKAFKGKWIKRF